MSRKPPTNAQPRPPNLLVRLVAGAGVSIRFKLLVAFLGITLLMAGLALFGLTALQKANERTEALIRDQERISVYYEIFGMMGEFSSSALAAAAYTTQYSSTPSFGGSPGYLLASGMDTGVFELTQMRRQIGRANPQDEARITDYLDKLKPVHAAAGRIRELRNRGETAGVIKIVDSEALPVLREIQRDAFTIIQTIERRMEGTARITAEAFLASRQQVIAAALVAIGLALLTGYAMSSALVWPVRRIGEVLNRVAGGGFEARVAVPNRDELGVLADNVNTMSARLGDLYDEVEAQKDELQRWNTSLEDKVSAQVDEIDRANRLRRFLPPQVADLIVKGEDGDDLLGVRRGEVTVLFADLRGFTAFSNTMPPAAVMGALNAFHAAAGPVIETHGGTIERFLGDGLMVVFGAPVAMEDAAQQAVQTALDMRDAVVTALEEFSSGQGAPGLGLGIGIGSGVATLGQIGFEGRQDYSAIGPAPNLAARLCDKAAAGQILMSHATAWQVTARMSPVGPFDLKGIGPDVAAFEVIGPAEDQ